MHNEMENAEPKLIFGTDEFISELEVVFQAPKNEGLCVIETGLSTIPSKPIPFFGTHPEGVFKGKDPTTVFNQDIVGTMGYAWIDNTGLLQLRAKISITDPDIKILIKQEKVLLPYAFWRDSSPSSSFDFDHLLIFPRKVVCE